MAKFLIEMPADAVEKAKGESGGIIHLTPCQMADILAEAKPVVELHTLAEIFDAGQAYAVKEDK